MQASVSILECSLGLKVSVVWEQLHWIVKMWGQGSPKMAGFIRTLQVDSMEPHQSSIADIYDTTDTCENSDCPFIHLHSQLYAILNNPNLPDTSQPLLQDFAWHRCFNNFSLD